MNRKERRKAASKQKKYEAQQRRQHSTATWTAQLFGPGKQVSDHATVMVMDDEPWTPFQLVDRDADGAFKYVNSRYQVAVYSPKEVDGDYPPVIHLAFKHNKNVAITDFRDFQRIKNELVNEEAYAIQVFPPESQMVDTSNHYHLWVMGQPGGAKDIWPQLPYGFKSQRLVMEEQMSGRGRQRGWPEGKKPLGTETSREAYYRVWKTATESGDTAGIDMLIKLSYQAGTTAGRKIEMLFAEFQASSTPTTNRSPHELPT